MAAIYVDGIKTSCMAIGGGGTQVVEKTYAKFNGHGIRLPFSINSDYKITVVFNQQSYTSAENIIGNAREFDDGDPSYSQLTIYNNKYYSSIGSSEDYFGTWSSGEHTYVNNNGNNHNEFDGVEVQSYTPKDLSSYFYTIGIRGAGSITIVSYIKSYKIESISTGDIICELVPCLFDGTVACLYDKVNKIFYYPEGLTVMDTIPTT